MTSFGSSKRYDPSFPIFRTRSPVDHLTRAERSENMRRIRGKNTRPELAVRKLVFSMGYRYRLHYAALPGRPDLAFPARRKAILVHGCFWHRHPSCKFARMPKSHSRFWAEKLRKNVARDTLHRSQLRKMGWKTMVIWECQTRKVQKHKRRLRKFLEG
jgi:DNA mismatch endonuclease (patch repair protein)